MQAQTMLTELQSILLEQGELSEIQLAEIAQVLAEADKDLTDGADEFLQLLHVASKSQRVIANVAG